MFMKIHFLARPPGCLNDYRKSILSPIRASNFLSVTFGVVLLHLGLRLEPISYSRSKRQIPLHPNSENETKLCTFPSIGRLKRSWIVFNQDMQFYKTSTAKIGFESPNTESVEAGCHSQGCSDYLIVLF